MSRRAKNAFIKYNSRENPDGYQRFEDFAASDDRLSTEQRRSLSELLSHHFNDTHDLVVYKRNKDFVVCDRLSTQDYITVLEFDEKCKHLMLYGYNPLTKTKHQRGHEAIRRMNSAREYAAQKGVEYKSEPPYGMNAGIADIRCNGSFDTDLLTGFMNIAYRTCDF